MKKYFIVLICAGSFFGTQAQGEENPETLGQTIDKLTYGWDEEAVKLNNYESLHQFCVSADYRNEIVTLLKDIHHYDSVLYDRLVKASRVHKDKEIQKTLKEIEKFEQEYSIKSFLHFLHEECVSVNKLEHHAKELKSEIGESSYDGQVYLIETELNKYIKHITKRVDNIRKHVHHLHVK